jgi:O-antigen ligase
VIRIAFVIFVASIPFETVLGAETFSLSRLIGWAFFALAFIVQPNLVLRKPPAAFWWFALFLVVFYVNGFLQGGPLAEGGAWVLPQLLVMFWIAYNLLRYQDVFLPTIRALVLSCVGYSFLQLSGYGAYEISGRVSALQENLDSAATVLALGLVAAVGIAYGRRSSGGFAKLAAWIGFAMMGAGVVKTASRGGIVALAAGIGVLVLRQGSAWMRLRNGLIVVMGVLALVVMTASFETSRARWTRTFAKGIGPREKIYPAAVQMVLERPIRGWGAGTMVRELGLRTGQERRDTHNLYLWVLTEDGLIGAIPYFLGLGLCIRGAWRGRRMSYGIVPLAFLAVDLVANLSLTWGARKLHWMALALALASERPFVKSDAARSSERRRLALRLRPPEAGRQEIAAKA